MIGEQFERLLEHSQLRPCRVLAARPPLLERVQRFDEWLERQLGADQIDRPADEDVEARRGARSASSIARRVLPMPASPATSTVEPVPACAASSAP